MPGERHDGAEGAGALLKVVRREHVVGQRSGCRHAWRSRNLGVGREVTARFAETHQGGHGAGALLLTERGTLTRGEFVKAYLDSSLPTRSVVSPAR
jgi:hypothetical protein